MRNKAQDKQKNLVGEIYHNFHDLFSDLLAPLRNLLPSDTEIVPVMKYEDAIRYFVTDRPKDPKIKKGIMLRQRHRQGQQFMQSFLDKDNQLVCQPDGIPYGRSLVVKQFDEELQEAFGDQDLIIVE
ncbi:MAG TPA: hypothetical protein DDW51_02970 [Cyanobacteria bacterium UBA11367]|nr:hypothetical protein [Cyanobacteria bacterium UBA11367]